MRSPASSFTATFKKSGKRGARPLSLSRIMSVKRHAWATASCFFRSPAPDLGSSFSGQNLVACPLAVAVAGRDLFEGLGCGRNSAKGNRNHHAPLARWLLHRTCRGTSTRTFNRALEIVWRYDWHDGAWPANIAQRLLGPA